MPAIHRLLRPMLALSVEVPAGSGAWFPSLLLDYEDDRALLVGAPLSRGTPVAVRRGDVVGVELPHADGLRRFRAEVLALRASPPALELSWPVEVERIQRRADVRIPIQLRTSVAAGSGPVARMAGTLHDLSVGGARVELPEPVAPGTEVVLTLHLPESEPHECHAVVLRSGKRAPGSAARRHWIAVAFTAVSPALQREITRLVFDVQRDLLRRDPA